MDITNRNFFRVLRQGAFGVSEELEPISQFKWNRILQIAMDQDLFPYIARGLMNHYNDKDICLPQASWNEISTEAQKKQPDIRSIILNILQQEPLPSNVLWNICLTSSGFININISSGKTVRQKMQTSTRNNFSPSS